MFLSGVLWTVQHVVYKDGMRRLPSLRVSDKMSKSKTHGYIASHPYKPKFDGTRVALLIEDRPLTTLAPLVLHFISVLPPDWSISFVGSEASIATLSTSASIKAQIRSQKIKITKIPDGTSIAGQELISRFMTTLWLWEKVLSPAVVVLVFQTDSIICSKGRHKIDHFLQWDWIGAPWRNKTRIGGNGGLSLRKRAPILEILKKEKRLDDDEFEDVWFTKRLNNNGRKVAPRDKALEWSGESQLPDSLLDGMEAVNTIEMADPRTRFEPVGYHIGYSGNQFHTNIWGTRELRNHVYDYCPEIKMLLSMDAATFVPGRCHSSWEWHMPKKDKTILGNSTRTANDSSRTTSQSVHTM